MTLFIGMFLLTCGIVGNVPFPREYSLEQRQVDNRFQGKIKHNRVCRALIKMVSDYKYSQETQNDDDMCSCLGSSIDTTIAQSLDIGNIYMGKLIIGIVYLDGIDKSILFEEGDYGIIAHPRNESHSGIILPDRDIFAHFPFSYYLDLEDDRYDEDDEDSDDDDEECESYASST
jgi:hypothetical protein